MARMIINQKWVDEIVEKERTRSPIDETISFNTASQWLVTFLSLKNFPFKVYNLGAGVKRITTVTDMCPMCKRKLI